MQYGPVKHWVKRKSTSHPPHQISLCLLLSMTITGKPSLQD